MSQELYYTPPPDSCFEEMKREAVKLWKEIHPEEDSYIKEKIDKIENIKNVKDNFMYILAMFDIHNMCKLVKRLSIDTKEEVLIRLKNTEIFKYLKLCST